MKAAEMKQKQSGESVKEYAYRISDIASRAYTDNEAALKEEACFSSFMKGLTDPDLKMKLHENTNMKTFEQAVDEATLLENIKIFIGTKSQPISMTGEDLEILRIDEDVTEKDQGHEGQRQQGRSRHANGRHNSYQSSLRDSGHSRTDVQPTRQSTGQPNHSWSQNRRSSTTIPHQNSNRREGAHQMSRRTRNGPLICYNCHQPNHLARNCTAPLNY